MTEQRLSSLFFSAIEDIHKMLDEWYDEYLHPHGSPITTFPQDYDNKRRQLAIRFKENLNQITEAIKEHSGE